MHLGLSAPPALVAPNIPSPLIPSGRTDLNILKAFQQIAGSGPTTASGHTLTLYLPGTSLTDEQASALSASFPEQVRTQQPLDLQLVGMFGGLGARQVPPDEIATLVCSDSPTASPSSHGDARSPPGYGDSQKSADQSPPLYDPEKQDEEAAGPSKVRKRQRLDSPSGPVTDAIKESTKSLGAALGVEDSNAHSLNQTLQHQIAAAHRAIARLEALHTTFLEREATYVEREAAYLEREAALGEQIAVADEKLAALTEASTEEYFETVPYINECMDELRQELVELLDDRLEAFGLDVPERVEVEEMVDAQVNAAVDDLKDRLAGGRVIVLFPE